VGPGPDLGKKPLVALDKLPARFIIDFFGVDRFLTAEKEEMALVIGVTGGSGAGKTTVVSILSQLGMERLDVDRVAHKFLLPGSPVFEKIVATFGEEYRQEEGIDRKRLGRLVFSSPAHRRKLEALVHPLLKKEVAALVRAARRAGRDLVLDHPLLFEMEMEGLVDEVWVVTVPRELQVARIMNRDKLTREEAEGRIAAQLPPEEKAARAAVVIENTGSLAELTATVKKLWEERIKKPNTGRA
jgi:dephospho-CoA kinase